MTKRLPEHLKKIADKGATETFLRAHVDHSGDACLLWPFARNAAGYGLATVGGHQTLASRWMCILAHGEPPTDKHEAAHSCGRGHLGCVNPTHLAWKTPTENHADRTRHGTANVGERNGKTTLTETDIRAIRRAPPDLYALAAQYGVSHGCISKIRSRQRWQHVADSADHGVTFHDDKEAAA